MPEVKKIIINENISGQRLDNFLLNHLKGVPKSKIYSIIRKGEGFTLADNAYTLATRDAGALEFFVNDVSVGSVGRRSQILTARKIERASILAKSR